MTLAKDPFPEMQAGISSRPLVVFSEYARRCRMSLLGARLCTIVCEPGLSLHHMPPSCGRTGQP